MKIITRDQAEDLVLNGLLTVKNSARVAFALSCSERLFPIYELFNTRSGWGDAGLLRHYIDNLWSAISQPEPTDFGGVEKRLIALAPDSDDFALPITGLAQYSVIAVAHAYEEYLSKRGGALLASRVSVDCLLEYVDWVVSPIDNRSAIDEDYDWFPSPIIQCEIEKQMFDLSLLRTDLSDNLVTRLKTEGYLGIQPSLRNLTF